MDVPAAAALERDVLRLAVRSLGEFVAAPARSKQALFADWLAALCARLGADGGVAAECDAKAPSVGPLRVFAACGDAAQRGACGDDLPRTAPVLAEALRTLAPAHAGAKDDTPARLAFPLWAGGEPLGAVLLEKRVGAFAEYAPAALAPLSTAGGELLLGYLQAGLRLRAESDLVRSQRHLRRGAALDGLTGLANRASSQRALEDAAARSHAAGLPLAVVVFDVDEAKQLADRLGGIAFDEAIALTARALHDSLRPSDWSGRWGIDAFVVALLGCDAESAAVVAERVRLRLEGSSLPLRSEAEVALTVSAGVAGTGLSRESGAQIAARALRALDEAKRAGRNRVCVSRPARA